MAQKREHGTGHGSGAAKTAASEPVSVTERGSSPAPPSGGAEAGLRDRDIKCEVTNHVLW